jgi:hypothetical protein
MAMTMRAARPNNELLLFSKIAMIVSGYLFVRFGDVLLGYLQQ